MNFVFLTKINSFSKKKLCYYRILLYYGPLHRQRQSHSPNIEDQNIKEKYCFPSIELLMNILIFLKMETSAVYAFIWQVTTNGSVFARAKILYNKKVTIRQYSMMI